jgi:FKBP-type peptidyl-prolyl cis-trans isomerase FklB
MLRFTLAFCGILCGVVAVHADEPKAGEAAAPALKTTREQGSYAIGLNIGRSFKRDGLPIDAAALAQGIKDALADAKPRLTDAQIEAALDALQKEADASKGQVGEKNKEAGKAFLDANKKKEGVVTLPSGLQYMVIKEGTGATPKATDTVRTHYHGTLIDGTVFDSSVERGQPISFPVGGVIRGWTEALQLMKVGSKWKLFIPGDLAYGPRGAGADIGPHATLIFEVELLDIE